MRNCEFGIRNSEFPPALPTCGGAEEQRGREQGAVEELLDLEP